LNGLIYIVAASNPAEMEKARAAAFRLLSGAGRALKVEQRELPGIIWGCAAPENGAQSPGDRLSSASRGKLEAVLHGDPVWLEGAGSRSCTAEEVLKSWEREGPKAAALLDNLSLAIVANTESGELSVVTDRTGGIRLYSSSTPDLWVASTSYLLLSKWIEKKTIDGDSIAAFFHLGYFPGRRSALRGVEAHPFASITRIAQGRLHTEPYWRPQMAIDSSLPLEEVLHGAVDAFNTTVREYASGRDRMYLAMTAGLDSRSVASSLIHQRVPFETYTHGFPGCWEARRVSSIVARHGITHRFVPLNSGFTERLRELALESFRSTEGEISCIEKSHLLHVLSLLREDALPSAGLLLGGGAGMLKGTFYRLLRDEDPYTPEGVDAYIQWNLSKRLPEIFAPEVPVNDRRVLRDFVTSSLDEAGGGSFFQRLDYFYLVRYRRWAGGVKGIYRKFFPVREPFVSAHLLDYLFRVNPVIKSSKLPHFEILSRNFPELQLDLTNKMTPALPFNARNFHRFLPSAGWRAKQVLRGFSRRYLPFELFPLVDYVDYPRWIREESGQALVRELLEPGRMKSAFLYEEGALKSWLDRGPRSFPLIDKICTLELYFREIKFP
jgi:hypothetical protein